MKFLGLFNLCLEKNVVSEKTSGYLVDNGNVRKALLVIWCLCYVGFII